MKHHSRWFHTFLTISILFSSLAFSLASVQPVSAQSGIWYVSTAGSDSNACNAPESPCLTINGAIAKAVDGDTVQVAVGMYTAASGTEVVLINKSITLLGGWDETFTTQNGTSTIDGGGARRGLTVLGSSYTETVVIDHFTIQNGFVGSGGSGGGIYNSNTTLTVINSIIRHNVSKYMGGGILNLEGTLTITNTTISENSAGTINSGGGEHGGGGIHNLYGSVTLNNSTISNNKIFGDFAGSGINTHYEILILNNSTVSGNTGSDEGIYIFFGTLILNNSTITNNQLHGVTIWGGTLRLQNSVIAGNGTGGDCSEEYEGIIASQGYNLIGNSTGCPFTRATGDLVGTSNKPIDPKLGSLQDNGGPTFTHALYSISPAVDAGNPAEPGSGENACLLKDQRGVTRPKGTACDIGAYEGSVLKVIPTILFPKGIITDTTPTYKWEKLDKATKYQYQLLKGTKIIYTKTVPASACGATQCTNTPTTVLSLGTYKWKVRALIGGRWKSYSPSALFTLFLPKAGFWKGEEIEFYVTPNRLKVDNFTLYANVRGCGIYKITHKPLLTIKDKKFSFTGGFYANGSFTSLTKAQGMMGLYKYYIPGCGYATGGPFSWTTVWKNGSQSTMVVEAEDDFSVTLIPDLQFPELQLPFDAFTVEPVE
jgi:hypothetical protein